jgi:ubiquinone/menaquinone biosynthesis C-methylase UbiE
VFSRAAATYDRIGPRIFAHFGQRLVAHAHLSPGTTVLDVAAGRGAVLFPAAEQVRPGGWVVGIDLATEMVRETNADIQRAGWSHVTIHQMDAEQINFADASFDRVLCGFALWFFPQPHRALREFFRVLKPGGRVILTTWAEDCPFLTWCSRELAASRSTARKSNSSLTRTRNGGRHSGPMASAIGSNGLRHQSSHRSRVTCSKRFKT